MLAIMSGPSFRSDVAARVSRGIPNPSSLFGSHRKLNSPERLRALVDVEVETFPTIGAPYENLMKT